MIIVTVPIWLPIVLVGALACGVLDWARGYQGGRR